MRQAIDSILTQTFADFEFLIVNDLPERKENGVVLAEYEQNDARVHIITNDENMGLTKSLNRALDKARGEYIARMDTDDISLPQRFETQIAYLDAHPEVCAVGSWTMTIDEKGKKVGEIGKYEPDPQWARAQFLQNSQVAHPAAMFRRKINDFEPRYDETVRYAQDYSLWVSLLPHGEIANVPEVLFCYRMNGQQITSNKKDEQQRCAGVAQRKAFSLFGFNAQEDFLTFFFTMTIKREMDLPKDVVHETFCRFFKENKTTKDNSLALEIVYSTYLAYFHHRNKGYNFRCLIDIVTNSSPAMWCLGGKMIYHLDQRKKSRRQ